MSNIGLSVCGLFLGIISRQLIRVNSMHFLSGWNQVPETDS